MSGLALLILGLYYPFEKRQKIDLQKNNVELSDSTLLIELKELERDITSLSSEYDQIIKDLDSLVSFRAKNPTHSETVSKLINEKKNTSNKRFEEIKKKRFELELKRTKVDFKTKEVQIHESHLKEVRSYALVFIIIGIILSFYGGIKWYLYFKNNNPPKEIKT